jgi:hypothetical protein
MYAMPDAVSFAKVTEGLLPVIFFQQMVGSTGGGKRSGV